MDRNYFTFRFVFFFTQTTRNIVIRADDAVKLRLTGAGAHSYDFR